jgi:hypothetical protein
MDSERMLRLLIHLFLTKTSAFLIHTTLIGRLIDAKEQKHEVNHRLPLYD